ncbi:unnamed protein product [Symbiodinium sp. CCMP2456]|nr:unnamed protein product [Symbiodinium sp. CCMP2456]
MEVTQYRELKGCGPICVRGRPVRFFNTVREYVDQALVQRDLPLCKKVSLPPTDNTQFLCTKKALLELLGWAWTRAQLQQFEAKVAAQARCASFLKLKGGSW